MTQDDRAYMERVSACWVSFAKSGRPDCIPGGTWAPYDAAKDELALFRNTLTVRSGFRKPQLDLLLEEFFRASRLDAP
jgi:para-nitrobenzyl esterase